MTRLPDDPKKYPPGFTSVIRSSGYPVILLIRLYQYALSPLLGVNCRFAPSCSHYAVEALETHGVAKGGILTFRRLLRCHPWGNSGYDPVPPPRS